MLEEIKKPFRITLEHYDERIVIEKNHSDVELHEALDMCRSLLIASGFHPNNIDEFIKPT